MQTWTIRSVSLDVSTWLSPAGSRQLTSSPASHQRDPNRRRDAPAVGEGVAEGAWAAAAGML